MVLIYLLITFLILLLSLAPTLFSHPVRSVISFICVFLLVAGLLININVEFLAFVYAIVYIGAVAVLFLFVVMLLKVSSKYYKAVNIYGVITLTFFILVLAKHLITLILHNLVNFKMLHVNLILQTLSMAEMQSFTPYYCISAPVNELHAIASRFYSLFNMLFIETAFVLLIALIAVIVLTSNEQKH